MFLQAVFLLATICRCDGTFNLDEEVTRIFASPPESTEEVIIHDLWDSERVQTQAKHMLQKLVDADSTTPEGEPTVEALKSYGKEICEALVLFIDGHYNEEGMIMKMLNAEARKHPSKDFDLSQPFHKDWYNILKISGVKFNAFPIKGVNFLLNKCKTVHLRIEDCRNISIEVYEALKSTLLNGLRANNVDLDEIPCLSNLPNLQDLHLEDNCLKALDADRYYDKESNTYAKMHHLHWIKISMVKSYFLSHLDCNLCKVFVNERIHMVCALHRKMYADSDDVSYYTKFNVKLSSSENKEDLVRSAQAIGITLLERSDPGSTPANVKILSEPPALRRKPVPITYEEACRRGYDVVG